MKPTKHFPWLLTAIFLFLSARLCAAEGGGEDAKMRAALRDLTLQLRTAQADLATAQAAQAALTTEKKELGDKYEALRKQAAADRAAGEKISNGLGAQVADLKVQVAKLGSALEASKSENEKLLQTGHVSEEQRAKLAGEMAELRQRLADREAKNLALFLLGNEILTRYEDFSLGNALKAKEPFVGLTRTRLENLVQDYEDKLQDQRVKN